MSKNTRGMIFKVFWLVGYYRKTQIKKGKILVGGYFRGKIQKKKKGKILVGGYFGADHDHGTKFLSSDFFFWNLSLRRNP